MKFRSLAAGLMLGVLVSAQLANAGIEADYVIRGGMVYEGSGKAIQAADVAIRNNRIVAVGSFKIAGNPRIIDAEELIVAPGFIDLHTHSDFSITRKEARSNVNYLRQGVTTIVTGNCGAGRVDVAGYFRELEKGGIATNVIHLIPQGTVRQQVVGIANRPATAAELEQMQALVERGMRDGAWGMSTGLSYLHGSFSSTDELAALTQVVGRYGGIYATHMRNQGQRTIESIQEALAIGKRGNVPVHISHLGLRGRNSWGMAGAVLRVIEEARRDGQQVSADQYPYVATSTTLLAIVIPPALRTAGELRSRLDDPEELPRIRKAIEQRLRTGSGVERLVVAEYAADRSWQGKSLAELARLEKTTPVEIVLHMLRQKGTTRMIGFSMNEEDVRRIMQAPFVATASDGRARGSDTADQPHPRHYGTFPRKLGKYVRDEKVVSLPHALRSCTGLPADILDLPSRGYLRNGYFADIVVFDRNTISDAATFENPHQYGKGVRYLFVNGTLAIDQDEATGALAGMVLRHNRKDAATDKEQ